MDGIQGIPEAFSENNRKLENFVKQIQENFTNSTNILKDIQDNLRQIKIDVENSLKELELELSQNQSLLSKWLAGSNTKLQQKQVSQRRMVILEELNNLENAIEQLINTLTSETETFTSSSQQLTLVFRDLENRLKNGMNNQYTVVSQLDLNPVLSVQQTIQQAIDTLNSAQANIAQNRIFSQISSSLDNVLQ
ncbi:hypothetical protein [Thermosediminibacter litoriperuensis]|uniref:Uncharacterized protein n=1 Tax=Thermosediminibacter litoriperuensis TaxID=291989 RepID=A0A5S5AVE0_9FIRM|nr:hypothetical protein [Thermosediminibacter litoriperuensis]TYP56698.1 hypothetical protein LZ11_00977 [Thermosediminibacter litoriperuensis]